MSRHGFPTISLRSTAGLCSETEQVMLLSDASCALQRADTEKLIALGRLQEAKDMLSQSEHGAFLARSAILDKERERFSEMSNGIAPVSLDNADDIQAYAKSMRHFYDDVLAATAITSALEAISLNAYQFPPVSPTRTDADDDIIFPEPQIAPWNWPVNTSPTAYSTVAPLSPLEEGGLIPFPVPSVPVQEPNCLGLTGLSETRPIRQRSRPALPAGHQKFNSAATSVQPLNLTVNTNINHHFTQDKPILQWRRSISDESTPAGEGISTPTHASSAAITPQTPNIPFRVKQGPLPLRSPALELLNTMSEDDHYEDDDDTSSVRAEPFGPSRSCTMDSVTMSED